MRLMILTIIAIVPIVAERVYNEHFDRAERIDAAYKQALALARQAAAAQSDVIVTTRALLQVLAATRVDSLPSDGSCDRFLGSVVTRARWIRTLSVANRDGVIACSSNSDAIGLNIKTRQHFAIPIKTGEFYVSDYFMGTRDKAPFITAALPERAPDGSVKSVILATLDLHWLGQIASALASRSGSIMLLIDSSGTVLAHEPNPENWIGKQIKSQPFVRDMLARPEGIVASDSFDNVRRIFAFVKLSGANAHVAIGFDENEVLSHVDSATWRAFAGLGIVTLVVLLCIWFGAERLLLRPVRALTEKAARVGRGQDEVHSSSLPWVAEFIPLAVAMDEMTEKLRQREQQLRDTNSQLRELAQTDGLTGLPNRRSFNDHLLAEWKLAAKLRQPLSVLMIDVDFFKNFNDHYGHVQGDQCLRKVSGVLREGTRMRDDSPTLAPAQAGGLPPSFQCISGRARKADFAARYGGEEFAVLLQGADLDAALLVAERLRQSVEDLLTAHAGAPWGFVSISIGAAAMVPSDNDNAEVLTGAADAALYEAKRLGRNRVTGPESLKLSKAI